MIVTRPREWGRLMCVLEEIGARSVFLVGCGQCATVGKTGGEEEVAQAAQLLETEGVQVTGSMIGESSCHQANMGVRLRERKAEVEAAEAVIVFACGAGTQTIAELTGLPVLPGAESVFLGNVIRQGRFEERCQMCGDCVLDTTAGICPVTTCPKGLLNGPCGGMWDGKCEVLAEKECVHVRIVQRLASQGRAQGDTMSPKDHSAKQRPGAVDLRAERSRRSQAEGGPA